MGRPLTVAALVGCLVVAGVALTAARTPAPPPDAGVRAAEVAAGEADDSPVAAVPPLAPSTAPATLPATLSATLPTTTPAAPEPVPVPVELNVPSLGVVAPVDPVGVEPDGSMTIPADGARVGWYRFGPAPGAEGSAVLAGHVDTRAGGPGALFALQDLAPGDELLVRRTDGTVAPFTVVGRETITKAALPTDVIFDRAGPPRLTVVTCGGPFIEQTRSYRDNVVITAVPAGDTG